MLKRAKTGPVRITDDIIAHKDVVFCSRRAVLEDLILLASRGGRGLIYLRVGEVHKTVRASKLYSYKIEVA